MYSWERQIKASQQAQHEINSQKYAEKRPRLPMERKAPVFSLKKEEAPNEPYLQYIMHRIPKAGEEGQEKLKNKNKDVSLKSMIKMIKFEAIVSTLEREVEGHKDVLIKRTATEKNRDKKAARTSTTLISGSRIARHLLMKEARPKTAAIMENKLVTKEDYLWHVRDMKTLMNPNSMGTIKRLNDWIDDKIEQFDCVMVDSDEEDDDGFNEEDEEEEEDSNASNSDDDSSDSHNKRKMKKEKPKKEIVLDVFQRLDKLHEIFEHAYYEIIRQSSIECSERGILMERFWKQYVCRLKDVLKQVTNHNEELQKAAIRRLETLAGRGSQANGVNNANRSGNRRESHIFRGSSAPQLQSQLLPGGSLPSLAQGTPDAAHNLPLGNSLPSIGVPGGGLKRRASVNFLNNVLGIEVAANNEDTSLDHNEDTVIESNKSRTRRGSLDGNSVHSGDKARKASQEFVPVNEEEVGDEIYDDGSLPSERSVDSDKAEGKGSKEDSLKRKLISERLQAQIDVLQEQIVSLQRLREVAFMDICSVSKNLPSAKEAAKEQRNFLLSRKVFTVQQYETQHNKAAILMQCLARVKIAKKEACKRRVMKLMKLESLNEFQQAIKKTAMHALPGLQGHKKGLDERIADGLEIIIWEGKHKILLIYIHTYIHI
jgi:hypothetical protein